MNNNEQQAEDLSHPRSPAQYARIFFSGFAMGSADIVPGVSGGTMAFILGIYNTLLDGIKSFNVDVIKKAFRLDIRGVIEAVPFRFLITLGLGIGTAILLLANTLHHLLENEPTFIFAFFAGLIVASIVAIGIQVRWSPAAIVAFAATAVFAFVLVGIDTAEDTLVEHVVSAVEKQGDVETARAELLAALSAKNYDNAETEVDAFVLALENGDETEVFEDNFTTTLYEKSSPVTLFFSGMIAICAMILPGISGSFILLILGQYSVVLGAVKNFDLISIGAVGAGCAIGIIAFSRVLSWLLKHYENVTIAALVGFMAGSMRLIWSEAQKGVEVVSNTGTLSSSQTALAVGLVLFGFILVSLLDHLQSGKNPLISLFWKTKPSQQVDVITEKAEALE